MNSGVTIHIGPQETYLKHDGTMWIEPFQPYQVVVEMPNGEQVEIEDLVDAYNELNEIEG